MFEESPPPPPLYQFSLPPSSIGPLPTTSSRLMSTASAGGVGHPGQFYYQMMPPPPSQISHARDQFMSNTPSQRDSNYAQLVNGDLFNQVAASGNSQLSPNSVIYDSLYIVIIALCLIRKLCLIFLFGCNTSCLLVLVLEFKIYTFIVLYRTA